MVRQSVLQTIAVIGFDIGYPWAIRDIEYLASMAHSEELFIAFVHYLWGFNLILSVMRLMQRLEV